MQTAGLVSELCNRAARAQAAVIVHGVLAQRNS